MKTEINSFVIEAGFLKSLAKFFLGIKDEFCINVTEEGFNIKTGGREAFAAVCLKMDKKKLKEFNASPGQLGIDSKQLVQITNHLEGEFVTVSIEKASLIFKTDKQIAKLRLIDTEEAQGIPDKIGVPLETELNIDCADLKNILKNCGDVSNIITLVFDGKELSMSAKSSNIDYQSKIELVKAIKNKAARARFNTEYFETLISGNAEKGILIKFGEQKAMEISYDFGGASVIGMLAPFVDEE